MIIKINARPWRICSIDGGTLRYLSKKGWRGTYDTIRTKREAIQRVKQRYKVLSIKDNVNNEGLTILARESIDVQKQSRSAR